MGRSKLPVIVDREGRPVFGGDYVFRYGAIDVVRRGSDATVFGDGNGCGSRRRSGRRALERTGRTYRSPSSRARCSWTTRRCAGWCDAPLVVTVEDHSVRTGLGACVAQWIALSGRAVRLRNLGVDGYQSSGAAKDLLARAGLDPVSIARVVREELGRA